jgi:hypothetical protein
VQLLDHLGAYLAPPASRSDAPRAPGFSARVSAGSWGTPASTSPGRRAAAGRGTLLRLLLLPHPHRVLELAAPAKMCDGARISLSVMPGHRAKSNQPCSCAMRA